MGSGDARRAGGWAPLDGHYYFDDRIAEAGPAAELLFIRSLAFCAATLSDGFMSSRQVRRLVAIGLDDVDDLCKVLVETGLWERDHDQDGYRIRRWLKWNRSREEIEVYRARDAARKRARRSSGATDVDGVSESARNPAHKTEQDKTEQDKGLRPDPPVSGRAESPVAASPPPIVAELRATLDGRRRARRKGST